MAIETVFIGFGSNLGDRQEYCDRAISLLRLLPLSTVSGISSYYETEPVDPSGDLGLMWFFNGVVQLETSLDARKLLDILQETERALGRDEERRNGPRTIDFDILFFGHHVIQEKGLTVPHPRLQERRFVLEPLVELAPDWVHPSLGRSARELLDSLEDPSLVKKLDITPGAKYGARPTCSLPPGT